MPKLISGPDSLVIMLHEELRSWQQQGVAFTLANDGTIGILTESRDLNRKAQAYRSEHSEALRSYLAFTAGRDPDDAIRHLELAWYLRDQKIAAMTETPYIPTKVAPLIRKKDELVRMIADNTRDGYELKTKLTEVENKIKETMGEKDE